MITFINGLFLITALILSIFFYRKIFFNPIVVFFTIWFFNLFLYELDTYFGFFYVRLSSYAEILFAESFFLFLIGSLTVALPLHGKNRKKNLPEGIEIHHLTYLYKITKFLLFIFLVAVLYKYVLMFLRYGNPFDNLSLIRYESSTTGEFAFPVFLRFLTLSGYLVILNLGILVVFYPNKKMIFLILLTLMLSYLSAASIGGRGSTFIVFLFMISTILITIIIRYNKIKLKHLFGGIIAIIMCLLLLTTIVYLRSDKSVSFSDRFVVDSYIYIVGTVPATSFFVENPWPSSLPGYNVFAGIYQLIDIVFNGLFSITFLVPEDTQVYFAKITTIGPFNSASHLTYYYSDFGELGVIIFSYLLGFIASYLFFKAIYFRRILDIQLLAVAMANILFSIRGTFASGMNIWIIFICLILQHYILVKSRKVAKYNSSLKCL